jgi:hypothetical protein
LKGLAPGEIFGWSEDLSADGTILAVGAIDYASFDPNATGYVNVYKYDGTEWIQLGTSLTGDVPNENFGTSVSLSDDGFTVAVGGPFNDANGMYESGHVVVFRYHNATVDSEAQWVQLGQELFGSGVGDELGIDLSLSADGTVLVAGANQFRAEVSLPGYARIFELNKITGEWDQRGSDIVGASLNDEFGWSTSLSDDGTIVAIAAPKNSAIGPESGHVSVFKYEEGTWVQLGEAIEGREAHDSFGLRADLSGDGSVLVVAAWNAEQDEEDPGYMSVFRFENGTWFQVGDDFIQNKDEESVYDQFGMTVSVSKDGSTVSMGTPFFDGVTGQDVGLVQVYYMG